jgi:hypothetical protein
MITVTKQNLYLLLNPHSHKDLNLGQNLVPKSTPQQKRHLIVLTTLSQDQEIIVSKVIIQNSCK